MKKLVLILSIVSSFSTFASDSFSYVCQTRDSSALRKFVAFQFQWDAESTDLQFYNRNLFGRKTDKLSVATIVSYKNYSGGWGDYRVYYFLADGVFNAGLKPGMTSKTLEIQSQDNSQQVLSYSCKLQ